MPIKYEKLVELRNAIIEESKDDLPRMEMFSMYMLAEMRLQTLIMAHYGEKKTRFVDMLNSEVDELVSGVEKNIEKENAKKT